jgi:virginiamycin A acetyltransferase
MSPALTSSETMPVNRRGGRASWLCASLVPTLYGMTRHAGFRALLRRMTLRLEGGAMYSLTVRDLYRRFHDLDVGLYTIGPCEGDPCNFAAGTVIGRYSSIYYTVRVLANEAQGEWTPRNGQHNAPASKVVIGNDVFIGHNAVIMASAETIGDGAFIGAGAVVQNPVPPYAVVMGNPARVVKYRFSKNTMSQLLESRWWDRSLAELKPEWSSFEIPLDVTSAQ